MASVVAQRYAVSLYEVASEREQEELVLEQIEQIAALCREQPAFLRLLESPTVPAEHKLAAIDEAFSSAEPIVVNLRKLLCEKHRIMFLGEVAQECRRLYNDRHGIAEVTAVTAIALTPALTQRLTEKLERTTGKRIVLKNVVDPSVLGGIVVNMGGTQIDDSLKTRLQRLQEELSRAI